MLRIRLILGLVILVTLSTGFSAKARADDPKPDAKKGDAKKAVSASGNWNWTVKRGDQEFQQKLILKQEGEKLTGTISGRQGSETEISAGAVMGSEVSFEIKREVNGNAMIIKYKGKLEGDTIKGKAEVERDGKKSERDWEAKREAAKA